MVMANVERGKQVHIAWDVMTMVQCDMYLRAMSGMHFDPMNLFTAAISSVLSDNSFPVPSPANKRVLETAQSLV